MFGLRQGTIGAIHEKQETRDDLPAIQITEKSQVVAMSLKLCYPITITLAPTLDSVETVLAVVELEAASIKYGSLGSAPSRASFRSNWRSSTRL